MRLDFPRSIYDVYEKLQSVGIRQSPHQITLSDEEGDDVRVKLYSEDETGKHLITSFSMPKAASAAVRLPPVERFSASSSRTVRIRASTEATSSA